VGANRFGFDGDRFPAMAAAIFLVTRLAARFDGSFCT
jgi:hypothetical protein